MKNTIHVDLIGDLLYFTRITCLNIKCRFNGSDTPHGGFFCRLKDTLIDADGKCMESTTEVDS